MNLALPVLLSLLDCLSAVQQLAYRPLSVLHCWPGHNSMQHLSGRPATQQL